MTQDVCIGICQNTKNLWEILVPTVRNNGKPYRTKFHRIWDQKVKDIAGGLSILQPLRGYWLSPDNKLWIERMIPVRIMCSEDEIEKIVNMSLEYYEQEAIMYYLISRNVIIKHKNS